VEASGGDGTTVRLPPRRRYSPLLLPMTSMQLDHAFGLFPSHDIAEWSTRVVGLGKSPGVLFSTSVLRRLNLLMGMLKRNN
jgi:hypothetical protein